MKKKRLEEIKQREREREKGSTVSKVLRRKAHQDMRMADQTETALHSPHTINKICSSHTTIRKLQF